MANSIYSHYFDWAATAPTDNEILKEALEISMAESGNPSSIHQLGINAKKLLTEARNRAAKAIGVKPETLTFTSGGTESDYIPLLSLLARPVRGTILISAIEHPAIREQAMMMKNCGFNIQMISPDKNGIITPERVEEKITNDTLIICVMAVNNETGAIQPIYDIAKMITNKTVGKRRPIFHVDAVQAAGKIPLDLSFPGIDSASISAHKIGGPRGIGLLYAAHHFESFIRGGGQEAGIRSGTENLFGAIALSKCLEKYFLCTSSKNINEKANELCIEQKKNTSEFIKKIKTIPSSYIIPETRQDDDDRFSPWVLQVAFSGIPGEVMVRALNEKGFYISTGSACSARKQSRPILEAMGISRDKASSGVRFSFGSETTNQSMDELFEAIHDVCKKFL